MLALVIERLLKLLRSDALLLEKQLADSDSHEVAGSLGG
jgi:hypothetical protein